MKATFRIDTPSILLEAEAGDLFAPLGPDLVECVCALRCRAHEGGHEVDWPNDHAFHAGALMPLDVVVMACRVGKGEPEYYPPGHSALLPAATPIAFLEQVAPLALRARRVASATPGAADATPHGTADLGRDAFFLPLTSQLVNLTHFDSRQWPRRSSDVTRPELASRL